MSRLRIIKKLKEKNPSLSKKQIENILDIFTKSLRNVMLKSFDIEIRSFGRFFIKKINEKKAARNPKTGELLYIPPKNKISFKASKQLKEFINKK